VAPEKPYVLVVDDSPDGREMLTEYLIFRGFEVVAVADGESALARVRDRHPALILMDLQMPGLSGWDATRQLKAHPETQDIIVIALTAHAMMRDEGIARQAGCDGFIPKPFDIKSVGNVVTELLARGRAALSAVDALTPSVSDRDAGGPAVREADAG
jgi:two-component system cell cycle response regulator DivK